MRHLTINNFEGNESRTVCVGVAADLMVRRDREYWKAFEAYRDSENS